MPQKTISLIETADTNTTVRTLSKLARGMGKVLTIRFADADEHEARASRQACDVECGAQLARLSCPLLSAR